MPVVPLVLLFSIIEYKFKLKFDQKSTKEENLASKPDHTLTRTSIN